MPVTSLPSAPGALSPSAPVSRWPGHVATLRSQGRLLMERGDYGTAGPVWESLRRSLPGDPEARHCLAQIRNRLGAQQAAVRVPACPPQPVCRGKSFALTATQSTTRRLTAGIAADDILLDIHTAARMQDPTSLLAALETAREALPAEDANDLVALHGPSLLTWASRIDHDDDAIRNQVERRMARLVAGHAKLILALLWRIAEEGRAVTAAALLDDLTSRPPPVPDDAAAVLGRIATLVPGYAEDPHGAALAARLLGSGGHHGAAIDWWRTALSLAPGTANRRGLLAALRAAGDDGALAREIGVWLTDSTAPAMQSEAEQNAVIRAVRHLVQSAQRRGDASALDALEPHLANHPPGPLVSWIAAGCALARNDGRAALAHLDAALRHPRAANGPPLDLHAERALVLMRDHLYGEALEAFALADPASKDGLYTRRRQRVEDIATFCNTAAQPLRYPECLVDIVMDEVAARPITYVPKPRHVAMVSGSLGQGGGERQTQTMVRRLLAEPRIARLTLLIRSVHLKPGDDFFYDTVKALPVAHHVYGRDWAQPSTLATALPELASRPRLAQAIALMPHNMREEIIRLCRSLWDHRPQAVHIWQDMHAAALACHIAGVPRFFIHRGSLSPDYWAQNSHQTATHFRPMRHCYRRLLERPDFVILNNSQAGCRTDQDWLGWPDAGRFRVIYNAVDFAALGRDQSRNLALREALGIAEPAAPVIGGSFRLQPVKRPLWWAEVARLVLQAVPDAHFLIIGDGDMTDALAAFAASHGFGHRLHLPGRVSNVGDWYRAMDVKLLTSEREGIPNAIIEAQHFGVPVVATDVGGVAEAIAHGESGFAVKAQAPADYADAVIRILRDSTWRARARQRAPAYVHAMFSLDTVVDQLCGLYGLSRTCRSDADTGAGRDNARHRRGGQIR